MSMTAALIALALIVGPAAVGIAVIALSQGRALDLANRVVAGVPTRAPRSWAVSHDPEAVLHRRLRDAMRALAAITAWDTVASAMLRMDLEQTAGDLDDHLVAIARLPAAAKAGLIASASRTVAQVEAAVGDYAAATGPDTAVLAADIAALRRQVDTAITRRRALGS